MAFSVTVEALNIRMRRQKVPPVELRDRYSGDHRDDGPPG
jgi:hypothetical protein